MVHKFLLTILFSLLAINIFSQSGRVKQKTEDDEEKKKTPKGIYLPTQKIAEKPKTDAISTPTPLTNDEDINIEAALVPIPVSVIDNQTGRALTNLDLKDFELKVDGNTVEIGEIFRSESPVRLALLFDNSSSVTVAREFEQKAAIQFFKRVIRPDKDLAALYSVATTAELQQILTTDVSALIQSIKSLPPPEGATSLHDALIEASNYLEDYTGRRVIVVVSDGQDTLSDATFDEMVKAVQENNCQVYIVHTNEFENQKRTGTRGGNANLQALAAEHRMKILAEQTGGAVYSPVDEDELETAFNQISVELANQYILGYYPDEETKDNRFRTIDLKINSDKNLTIRARKGYYVSKR